MLDQSIQDLLSRSLARIESAQTPDELEAVRVDALGRKGALAGFSKEMGKLPLEEKKRFGVALNDAKQRLESAFERRKLRAILNRLSKSAHNPNVHRFGPFDSRLLHRPVPHCCQGSGRCQWTRLHGPDSPIAMAAKSIGARSYPPNSLMRSSSSPGLRPRSAP